MSHIAPGSEFVTVTLRHEHGSAITTAMCEYVGERKSSHGILFSTRTKMEKFERILWMEQSDTRRLVPRVALTQARQVRGLSQAELAECIGTTFVNVSRWERGLTAPSPLFRTRLCTLFKKTEDELRLFSV